MRLTLTILVILGLLVVVSLYGLYLWYSSQQAVQHMDRQAVNLCDKHGVIREADMLTIFDDPETGQKVKKCPLCFREQKRVASEHLAVLEHRRDEIAAGQKTTR